MDRERGGRILQRTARQPMLILQNTPPLVALRQPPLSYLVPQLWEPIPSSQSYRC
jgi:hypothetical protein